MNVFDGDFQMRQYFMRRFAAHLAAALLACALLVLTAPGFAMPMGGSGSFAPARADEQAPVWKANVICRTWREGNTQRTAYCLDGWVCAPGDKCEPGPAIREQMEKRKNQLHDALEKMRQQLQAQSRDLHKRIRLSQQAPLGTPNNTRAIQTYLAGNNCSTITGLPGPTPPGGTCATSGPLPRPPTHAMPNRVVAARIYPNLPPDPIPGLVAAGSPLASDLDSVLASVGVPPQLAENEGDDAKSCTTPKPSPDPSSQSCEPFYREIGFHGKAPGIFGIFWQRRCKANDADCLNACTDEYATCKNLAQNACRQLNGVDDCCEEYLKRCSR